MSNTTIPGGAAAALLAVLALAAACGPLERDLDDTEATSRVALPTTSAAAEAHPSFLYGRITTVDGDTYEGRIRFGGDQEAFWGDYFNGFRDENPWLAHAPSGERPTELGPIELLGIEIRYRGPRDDIRRPFMTRFGDVEMLEARGRDLWVTLKGGKVAHLDRYAADDFADGVRVWDGRHGVVDLGERPIRTIEFLSPPRADAVAPDRLHGTVRTRQGDFTGFLQWNRRGSVGLDELEGVGAGGERVAVAFDVIRSIAWRSAESARVTLLDGREMVLSGASDVGPGHRGIYVDDPRYGRVLVSWDAFERVDFGDPAAGPGAAGPAYADFPAGGPLTGSVTTRDGRRLAGRLVYDLDETEITETLDAPSRGVDYTIPFGLVASIALPGPHERAAGRAGVTLRSGEELRLERAGDLGDGNAGMLVFVGGRERPEYVSWTDVERVDFDRPAATYPAVGGR